MKTNEEPRKRGRPATGEAPQRNVRVSEEDWQLIAEAADKQGVSRSEFMRAAAIQQAKKVLK